MAHEHGDYDDLEEARANCPECLLRVRIAKALEDATSYEDVVEASKLWDEG